MDKPTTLYIDYLSTFNGHKSTCIEFSGETWEEANKKAVSWAKENLENYNSDMIKMK
jgi:hypothetical protein